MENYYFGILLILILFIFLAFFTFMKRRKNISEYLTQNENIGDFGEGASAIFLGNSEGTENMGSAAGGGGGWMGGSSYFVGKIDPNNGKYIKSSGAGGQSYTHPSVQNVNYSTGESLSDGFISLFYNDPSKITRPSQPELSTQTQLSSQPSSTTIKGEPGEFNISMDYSPTIINKDC